jgi:two-component system, chemotaxis family, sensor kinase CheA
MNEMDGIVKEFLLESNENLDRLDRDLIELEKNPTSQQMLAGIFRTIHSIKGATGFLGFAKLGEVTHAGESLLSRLRDGVLILNPEITSGLLALVDAIRQMLSEIGEKGVEGDGDHTALIERLRKLQEGGTSAPPPPQLAGASAPVVGEKDGRAPVKAVSQQQSAIATLPRTGRNQDDDPPGSPSGGGQGRTPPSSNSSQAPKDTHSRSSDGGSLRVDVHQLDKLMDLVGELVLVRNQILQISSRQTDPAFVVASQRLNLISSEIQEGVAKSRMQPIDNIWNKVPRLMRDLTIQCGKKVRLQMDGNETELDKTLLEAIQDPLTHLVRNAVDHGIEAPEARVAAGKPAEGCLILRAFHENGEVNIEISDDGAGIDLNRIRQKAVEKGLITPEKARGMDDREVLNLIFLPGFSTAQAVTNVSGRGVGMDVVRTNIEKIGGTIEVRNSPGLGTTMRIRIPLTLAIISTLMVSVRGDRYAIPQVNAVELMPLHEMEEKKQIDRIPGTALCRLRGRILPLLFLDSELQLKRAAGSPAPQEVTSQTQTVVILQARDRQFGLVVDQVHDTEEVVVKPLGKHLKGVPIYAGATILGDGRVALILDVPGLARRASVAPEAEASKPARLGLVQEGADHESKSLLVVEGPNEERLAIPLSDVARLEEFPRSAVEMTGDREVLQYRDEILLLVRIPELLSDARPASQAQAKECTTDENFQVVVCRRNGHSFGLVVNRIFDVVEHSIAKLGISRHSAGTACAVIQGRVTRILDMEELVSSAWLSAPVAVEMEA